VVALGGLIVSVASLAWTVYVNLRDRGHGQEPEADSISREVRIKLLESDEVLPPGTDRITEVVVTEIIRQARQPRS
jgi:hypothetical protein